jgi:hypothetical protein
MANVVGWRIVKEKHAKSAFWGRGASSRDDIPPEADGLLRRTSRSRRWRFHTQPVTIRDKFRVFRVSWDGKMMMTIDLKKLPKGWNATAQFVSKRLATIVRSSHPWFSPLPV